MKFEHKHAIEEALRDRYVWEQRMTVFYKMRHRGLRRIAAPYPGAPDLHFPLIDAMMERLKPFYYQQLYGAEQFAAFVSLKTQPADTTSAVAAWFDYRLKQRSNFERKILSTFDHMAMAGRGIMKLYWDPDLKQLCFANIDPIYFIVPKGTGELNDPADWCVHVMHMSPAQYKSNPVFNQDETFVKSITGRTPSDAGYGLNTQWQEKAMREGLTISNTTDQIILWEIWCKKGKDVYFDTYSPMRLDTNDSVRNREYLPYKDGVFANGSYPFISFPTEIKDEGWFSPRGLPEIVASFEDSMCRQWNGKHEYMDFVNKPMFKNTGSLGNTANVQFLPGQTLPQGIEPATMPSPPVSFDQEMASIRALAEYRMAIPDLGASQHLTGGYQPKGKSGTTATQIQAIIGQSGLSDDMRSRVVRLALADLYRMAYSIYIQYDRQSLEYVLFDETGAVPSDALHGEYEIRPNGSADSWNKPFQLQKAVTRFQMFNGNPYVDAGELAKSVLELDNPALIKRLWRDPGQKLSDQMEVQAQELSIMLLGFPAAVKPSDDDKAHLNSIHGFVDRRVQVGEPLNAGGAIPMQEFAKLLLQHGAAHDQALMQKKDPQAGPVRASLAPLITYLARLAALPSQTTDPNAQSPQNILPGPGASVSPSGGTGQAGTKPPDPVADATKVMNAFAALRKSGVPITDDQINVFLREVGAPPLPRLQPQQPMLSGAGTQ